MDAKQLIISFVNEKLDGDPSKLTTYNLNRIKYDKVYGSLGPKYDVDDTYLMRAIYCVVFGATWKNLTMDNSGEGKMRGDTINSFRTLFANPWDKVSRFEECWHPDETLMRKRKEFNEICFTMGNMTVLPDRRIDGKSINTHRGCHGIWHDYEDRFLDALYGVLLNLPTKDLDLCDLIELNDADFAPFYGEEGWRRFIQGNMLEYYVDDDFKPVITSKAYTYWRNNEYIKRERFFAECHRYIDFSTSIIRDRAERMLEVIKGECF